jgi:hypothetical protein
MEVSFVRTDLTSSTYAVMASLHLCAIFALLVCAPATAASPAAGMSAISLARSINERRIVLPAEAKAFRSIIVSLDGEGDDEDTVTVFRDGRVSPQWHFAPPTKSSTAELFLHDAYHDRIRFEVSYGLMNSQWMTRPEVKTSDTSVAAPRVDDFSTEDGNSHGSFSVIYECSDQPRSNRFRTVEVSIVFPVLGDMAVAYTWLKICGGGAHPHLDFGVMQESRAGSFHEDRKLFGRLDGSMVARPNELSTRVFLQLRKGTQEFFHVKSITSNSSQVRLAEVRGPVFGKVMQVGEAVILRIVYNCEHHGKANVSLEIPIPPFAPLTAEWVKDCGEPEVTGLFASSHSFTNVSEADIIISGLVRPEWEASLNALPMHSDADKLSLTEVNETTKSMSMFLHNTCYPLKFGLVSLTVENRAVVYAEIASPSRSFAYLSGSRLIGGGGGILATGEFAEVRVDLICKQLGTSRIAVSFPTKNGHTTIDVGFLKRCLAPRRWQRQALTADRAMQLTLFVVAFTACAGLMSRHRCTRQGAKKSAVCTGTLASTQLSEFVDCQR